MCIKLFKEATFAINSDAHTQLYEEVNNWVNNQTYLIIDNVKISDGKIIVSSRFHSVLERWQLFSNSFSLDFDLTLEDLS